MYEKLKLLSRSIRKRGLVNTFKFVLYEYLFDFTHKVNTSGYMDLDNMDVVGDKKFSTKYQGSNYFLLKNFFSKYSDYILNSDVVDFGSGKGRILIMAMEYKAKEVIGIEFSKELIDISKKNIYLYQNRNNLIDNVKLIHDDALNYKFSGKEKVIFFYNPFNDIILEPILKNIVQQKQNIIVVYINPVYKNLFNNFLTEIDNFSDELIVYSNENNK